MLQGKVSFFDESPEGRMGRPLAVIVRLISIQKFRRITSQTATEPPRYLSNFIFCMTLLADDGRKCFLLLSMLLPC